MPTGSTLTVVWTTILLLVPGCLIGLSIGLRGWLLTGAAPALTLGFTSALSLLLPSLHIGWSLTAFGAGLLVACAVLTLVVRPWTATTWAPTYRWPRVQHLSVAAAVVFSGVLGARVTMRGMGSLRAINQTWDAMFHANTIRYIATNGDAKPSSLAPLLSPEQRHFFYPDVFHALGALVMRSTGDPAQEAMNALGVPLALLLALSCVALVRGLTPRPAVAFCAALLSSMFTSMPYDLIHFGSLFPFALATAAMPAVAALVIATVRRPTRNNWIALAIAASGVFATHPSVGMSTAILCLLLVGARIAWPATRRALSVKVWIALGSAVALAAVLLASDLVGLVSQTGDAAKADWPRVSTPSAALGNLLFFGQGSAKPQWVLAGLFGVGLFALRAYRAMWPVVAYAGVVAAQYVLAAGYDGAISLRLTEFWWNDRWRFAALFIPVAIVVAAVGAVRIADALLPLARRIEVPGLAQLAAVGRRTQALPAALAAVGVVVLLVITGIGYHSTNGNRVATPYSARGPTVLPGELKAFAELRALDTGGQAVMNDPLDGTAWAYSEQGIPVVFKVPFAMRPDTAALIGADRFTLLTGLNRLDNDPRVRAALTRLNVGWVITGRGAVPPASGLHRGLLGLGAVQSLTLVWQNETATIYRVSPGSPITS